MIQIYAAIAALVLTVMTAGGFYIKSLRAERDSLTQAYSIAAQTAIDNKEALNREVAERGRVDRLLLERETNLRAIARRNGDLNALLDNLKRSDAHVRDWGDTPVPAAVLRLLDPAPAPASADPQATPPAAAAATHPAARHPPAH